MVFIRTGVIRIQKDGSRLDDGFYSNWGHTYYFGNGGVRLDDSFYFNWGNLYYFNSDGSLAQNQSVWENGNEYWAGSDGAITTGDSTVETAISAAKTQIGLAPYTWGGGRTAATIAAHQFDCSSFVRWAYAQAGISLNGGLWATTYTEIYSGTGVPVSQMKRGDLFFMDDNGHVGLYLGGGWFIHDSPSSPTKGVGINNLDDHLPAYPNLTWRNIITATWNGVYGVRRVA